MRECDYLVIIIIPRRIGSASSHQVRFVCFLLITIRSLMTTEGRIFNAPAVLDMMEGRLILVVTERAVDKGLDYDM